MNNQWSMRRFMLPIILLTIVDLYAWLILKLSS